MNTASVVALCLSTGMFGATLALVLPRLLRRPAAVTPPPTPAEEPDIVGMVVRMLTEVATPPDTLDRAKLAAARLDDVTTLRDCLQFLLWLATMPGSTVPESAVRLAELLQLSATWKLPAAEKQ